MNDSPTIPVETKNLAICKVKINIYQLVLNVGFKCVVYQYDEKDVLLQSTDLEINGNEYDQWTSDNEMINLILTKCGLVPKTIENQNVVIDYNSSQILESLVNPADAV
jgi:hypothetical protein